ncbi:cell division control protein 14 [Niveomyces insectorum RCEF 264]|uniref:Cell division control protein 14 n=1 Tax=Niveomyces insectorum RCEF 264 TaxID=1081102 RepID=A0A167MDZ7_9HYPO|nr:cell division control protein 14 [Niveomyces insectorum RCEF 264]
MEALLSLAFDNLSSYDGPKIKKGLKQVEGLLAPICLSSAATKSKKKQAMIADNDHNGRPQPSSPQKPAPPATKALAELADDPAFFAFFKLQEGFEWNIAQRLLDTLDRLLARGSDGQNDLLILSTLDLTQGVLLLHPPSRGLFAREKYMNLLLDLLEPVNCPAIQAATLLTLVVALLDTPNNTRAFEALDGLLTVTSLFRARATAREVKLRLVEFLYFYLMPETPAPAPAPPSHSPSKLVSAFTSGGGGDHADYADHIRVDHDAGVTRTTDEKQALLGRHLHNVDDLVRDLTAHTPFGGVLC